MAHKLRDTLWALMVEHIEALHDAIVFSQRRPTKKSAVAIYKLAQAIACAAYLATSGKSDG